MFKLALSIKGRDSIQGTINISKNYKKIRGSLCMKNLKKLLLITTFSFLSLILVGCSFEKNKTFTVTFDSNGGTEVKKQEVKANEKVEEPNEPTKEGYSFKGWYLSGKKYDFVASRYCLRAGLLDSH